jgi:hypothetical protein
MSYIGNQGRKLDHFLFGSGPKPIVPGDIAPMRGQMIQLLMQMLQPGAFNTGGAGSNFFFGGGQSGARNFLNSAPETSAYNQSRDALTAMLTGGGPQFERDIAIGNSVGGRFSSGNAIMRGEAYRNLYNQRAQTAQTLGNLQQQRFGMFEGADNQMLQLLVGLLGMGGQATLSPPIDPGSSGAFGDILKIAASASGSVARGGSPPTTSSPSGGGYTGWDFQ